MKKILFLLAFVSTSVFGAQSVLAAYGLGNTAEAAKLTTSGDVQSVVGNVIGAGLQMVGVLFLILMIYGGILWMTARGNEETTRKALNTIIAAVIGLVIVTASYAITNFVFSGVTTGQGTSSNTEQILLCCVYPSTPTYDIMQRVTDSSNAECIEMCRLNSYNSALCDTQATTIPVASASECVP